MNKAAYRQLCKKEKTIPVFSKDWWLDAVCGPENWDVVLLEKGGKIIAAWPYYIKKKYGFRMSIMPKLTQTMGIWLQYPEGQKHSKKISYEKEIFNQLIKQLPKVDNFYQQFHYSITNWLPFYWNGFQQTTRYTYVIEDLTDLDKIFSNFDKGARKDIMRAQKLVKVKFDLGAKEFYENRVLTLGKKGETVSYPFDVFQRICSAGYKHDAARTIYAVDQKNNIHAGLLVIWDNSSAYELISTTDPDFGSSGASSLLTWEIIKYIATKTTKYDFEGSMIQSVEHQIRKFGGVQTPYFRVSKCTGVMQVLQNINEMRRRASLRR